MFSGALSEKRLEKMGKIYVGKPIETLSRAELIKTVSPKMWKHFREDNGDLPESQPALQAAAEAA
jgi:hypothetical protein